MSDEVAAVSEELDVAFVRYRRLLATGFRDETPDPYPGALWLMHPMRDDVRYPALLLYPDGLVASIDTPPKPQLRIQAAEADRFDAFLAALPRLPAWRRTVLVPAWLLWSLAMFAAWSAIQWLGGR